MHARNSNVGGQGYSICTDSFSYFLNKPLFSYILEKTRRFNGLYMTPTYSGVTYSACFSGNYNNSLHLSDAYSTTTKLFVLTVILHYILNNKLLK